MADSERMTFLSRVRRLAAEAGGVSDAQLLDRFARDRDEAAFELLVWRHARLVFGVCRRVLGNVHDAEDAFQAGFLALARRAGRIRRPEAVAGWLYQVAYRAALAARARRARVEAREQALPEAEVAAPPGPAPRAERDEQQAAIDEEIGALPARFRVPVVLCYLEGKTVDEAARQLGCPRGTVASRLARARGRLRVRLSRRGIALSAGLASVTEAGAATRPFALIPLLVPAAVRLASGGAVGGTLSPQVASLTEEVLKAMFVHKLKTAAAVVITLAGLALAGGTWGVRLFANAGGDPRPERPDDPPPAAVQGAKPRDEAPAAKPKLVTVVRPVPREVPPYADFNGRLEASRTLEVRATANGRLENCLFNAGATVKRGQMLFEIDPTPYRLLLLRAQADLRAAEVGKTQADRAFERAQRFSKAKVISQEEMDKSQSEAAVAEAAYRAAQAALETVRYNLEATKIKAPGDGQISRPLVDVGNVVSAGDRPTLLATIISLDPIAVGFGVDERTYLRYRRLPPDQLKLAGVIHMTVSDGGILAREGTFLGFEDRVNPMTGTVRGRGVFPNRDRLLLPGMTVGVRMTLGKPDRRMTVPREALRNAENGRPCVWVVNDRNRLEERRVTVDWSDDGVLAVQPELGPNDRVIIGGPKDLRPGDTVQVQRDQPAKAEPKK